MTLIDKTEAHDALREEWFKSPMLCAMAKDAIAALPARGVGVTWHPFDTAPRDGSRFLAQGGGLDAVDICSYSARVGCWDCGSVTLDDTDHEPEGYNRPAQWMPLAALAPTDAPNLADPVTVHANMLRGTIAKPTVEQIIHLYGREAFRPVIDAAVAKALEDACLAVSEHADWPEDEHGRTEQVGLFARVINAICSIALAPTEAAHAEDPKCTDCGGTGITYQTERVCACQPATVHHVNETPKSEHDAGNVLTDAAQDDPECTCCGGTGITYQTEKRCACQPTDAAQAREAALDEIRAAAQLIIDRVLQEPTQEARHLRELMVNSTLTIRHPSLPRYRRWMMVNEAIRTLAAALIGEART